MEGLLAALLLSMRFVASPNQARRHTRRVHPVLSQHHYHWADRLTPSPRPFGCARAPHAHACACGPPATPLPHWYSCYLWSPSDQFGSLLLAPHCMRQGLRLCRCTPPGPPTPPRWAVPQPLRARLAASGYCGLDLWRRTAWRTRALEGASVDGAAAAWAAAASGAAGLAALDASDAHRWLMCRTF